ncbi:MAG: LuxR C-terminal-related transcriptional regulator [Melioribacteraceae bacterium]
MFISLPWLVLFLFTVILTISILIYEIRAKTKWKEQTFILEKENDNLKRQVSDPNNLQKEYKDALHKIEKKLTKRQFEIFILTVDGISTKAIEEKINISSSTINSHINEIKLHLNVEKRSKFANVILLELKQSFEI